MKGYSRHGVSHVVRIASIAAAVALTPPARAQLRAESADVSFRAALSSLARPEREFEGNGRFAVQYLVSDGSAGGLKSDPDLVNGWGVAAGPSTYWWVADNGTSLATLYDGDGNRQPLVVGLPSSPTGTVYYGGEAFPVTDGKTTAPARFLFATEDGKIAGWSPNVPAPPASPMSAFVVVSRSGEGAVYKGIAVASTGAGDRLYATDFHNGRVDVFDGDYKAVALERGFEDPRIPEGFAPFGIQNIHGRIFVTYAKQDAGRHDDVAGEGLGFVDVFDTDGRLLAPVATRGRLNAPWGMALAPPSFGEFGGHLLVGNFGDGEIHAFRVTDDMTRFTPAGPLRDRAGEVISVNGLWGIAFGNGNKAGPSSDLFFAAGPDDESHGAFGRITVADTR